jgi:hypothetical protein
MSSYLRDSRKNITRAYLEIEADSFDKWLVGSG